LVLDLVASPIVAPTREVWFTEIAAILNDIRRSGAASTADYKDHEY
jgi:hypothetical protein